MKTASVQGSSMSLASRHTPVAGSKSRLFMLSGALAQLRRSLADSLPAMGLAEGGDVDGAAELVARSRAGKS